MNILYTMLELAMSCEGWFGVTPTMTYSINASTTLPCPMKADMVSPPPWDSQLIAAPMLQHDLCYICIVFIFLLPIIFSIHFFLRPFLFWGKRSCWCKGGSSRRIVPFNKPFFGQKGQYFDVWAARLDNVFKGVCDLAYFVHLEEKMLT